MIELLVLALVVYALLVRRHYAALRAPRLSQRKVRAPDHDGRLRAAGVSVSTFRLSWARALVAALAPARLAVRLAQAWHRAEDAALRAAVMRQPAASVGMVHSSLEQVDARSYGLSPSASAAANLAALTAALDAMPATGGDYVIPPGTYDVADGWSIDTDKKVRILAYGAVLRPVGGATALTLNVTGTNKGVAVYGLTVDGQAAANTTGIKLLDHFAAVLRDVRVERCTVGVHITDATQFSESSDFDNLYVRTCDIGIKFSTNGGTGSFGYSRWGLVHIDNMQDNAIGIQWGAGTNFNFSVIEELVIHTKTTPTSVVGIDVDTSLGSNVVIHGIMEAFGAPVTSYGVDLNHAAANVTGTVLGINFDGSWTSTIYNPLSKDFYLRENPFDKTAVSTTQEMERYYVAGDSFPRMIKRADRIVFGSGSLAGDVSLARLATGVVGSRQKLGLLASTSFMGTFTHANTDDREYTLPNAAGTLALLSLAQTWSAKQTFSVAPTLGAAPSAEAGSLGYSGGLQVHDGTAARRVAIILAGTTAARPASPSSGQQYYDTTLGKPIWYSGSAWVDATGAGV